MCWIPRRRPRGSNFERSKVSTAVKGRRRMGDEKRGQDTYFCLPSSTAHE